MDNCKSEPMGGGGGGGGAKGDRLRQNPRLK